MVNLPVLFPSVNLELSWHQPPCIYDNYSKLASEMRRGIFSGLVLSVRR